MWMETNLASLRYYPGISLKELRKTMENPQNSWLLVEIGTKHLVTSQKP
jgi:hypothetical protein